MARRLSRFPPHSITLAFAANSYSRTTLGAARIWRYSRTSMSEPQPPLTPVPRLTWLQQLVRYALHVFVAYQILHASENLVPAAILNFKGGSNPDLLAGASAAINILFSHLFAFIAIPAFVAGLLINARFRQRAAVYVWVIPVAIFAWFFLFHGPGIYPTSLRDSDFHRAFHTFFGAIPPLDFGNRNDDWTRMYMQINYTLPVYGTVAYSLGAFAGMTWHNPKLRAFVEKF
jgi:hypothetical protein